MPIIEATVAIDEGDEFVDGLDYGEVEEIALEVIEEPLGGVGPGAVVRSEGEFDLFAGGEQGLKELAGGMGGEVVEDDGNARLLLAAEVAGEDAAGDLGAVAGADSGADLAVSEPLDAAEGEGAMAEIVMLALAITAVLATLYLLFAGAGGG